ncbi:hypothetical protein KXD93_18590 [Mucilaginibacter sp. BJC16-A38]|uniref:hypothetical protein n=1 Tax=Mucilaginibacter phenanthrenivorans TaxID=1234842 RepID=UPI0021583BCF|nr:hypothetical protein [Mucilaginibacter phenanthrenivorans]MCR8559671.1 hypothetical protein [Mucilaginibacter phenanthrenivorans]
MQITQIILEAIIILLTTYIAFVKSYSQEKGKNLATKEDIEEITNKIENVKSEVQHAYSQKSQYLEKNKLALINFYEEYVYWTEFSIKNISVVINQVFEPEKIREVINDLNRQQSVVSRAFWVLSLFELEDETFIKQMKTSYLEANNLCRSTFDYLISVETFAVNYKMTGVINDSMIRENNSSRERFIENRNLQEEIVNRLTVVLTNVIRKKMIEKYS